MLKPYKELRKVDVSDYCVERDGIKYLNWAMCVELLHAYGAETVYFEPVPNPRTGSSLYYTDLEFSDKNGITNRCYETRIKVVIDDKEYIMQSPVMNGANPVKDNSMSQQRVWNSMTRSFVKCVAIHTGLGFDMWMEAPFYAYAASEAQINTIKMLAEQHKVNMESWLKKEGRTWETLTETDAGNILNAFKAKWGDD